MWTDFTTVLCVKYTKNAKKTVKMWTRKTLICEISSSIMFKADPNNPITWWTYIATILIAICIYLIIHQRKAIPSVIGFKNKSKSNKKSSPRIPIITTNNLNLRLDWILQLCLCYFLGMILYYKSSQYFNGMQINGNHIDIIFMVFKTFWILQMDL